MNETYEKIPRVCLLGNLGNNPRSESSAEVLGSEATVGADDASCVALSFEITTQGTSVFRTIRL